MELDEWQGTDPKEALRLGNEHAAAGRLGKAARFYDRGLTLSEPIGEPEVIAALFHAMADAWMRSGDVERARDWYERALLVPAREPSAAMAESAHMAAMCRFNQGEHADALEWFERAASLRLHLTDGPIDYEGAGRSLHQAGFAKARLGDLDEAQAWLTRAAEAKQRGNAAGKVDATSLGMTYHLSGDLYFAQQKYDEALARLELAATSKERGDVDGKVDWSNVAVSYELGGFTLLRRRDWAAALPWWQRAAAAAEKGDLHGHVDDGALGRALRFVGMCQSELGDNQAALLPLTRANELYMKGVEDNRLELEDLNDILSELIACCAALGMVEQAGALMAQQALLNNQG